MVKAYLRYELAHSWGVITSKSSVCYDRSGKLFFTASLERVSVWDVKQATLVRSLVPPAALSGKPSREVTCITASPVSNQVAVGYGDGTIRLWSLDTWDCECTFSGHRSAVTALRYSPSGAVLASGAQDCGVVVWDVSGEAGLFRLAGHRGPVTALAFLGGAGAGRLASASKDEMVRVWDLDTQHCCQTVAPGGGEVWDLDADPARRRLAVGAADATLRVYSIDADAPEEVLGEMGSVRRAAPERAATVRYGRAPDGALLLFCQGAGKVTEVWRVRSEAEAQKRLKRRRKRRKEKGRGGKKEEEGGDGDAEGDAEGDPGGEELAAGDELELIATVRSKHKVTAAALAPPGARRGPARLVLSLATNALEVWELREGEDPARASAIDGPGHRSDVRALALSSDDATLLSTSNAGVKVWNPRTGAPLRTIDAGYGLAALFVPGNKHAVVGTKEGTLELIDVAGAARVAVVPAHAGPVWSLAALPDGSGFVSGSADKDVKFWEWDLVEVEDEEEEEGGKKKKAKKGKKVDAPAGDNEPVTKGMQLSIAHTRTLTMSDDVLCVRVSPDGRLLAVSLLDSTVRVFFAASLKFFLSLYGHKLPVLAMDISSDGTLLATGSADKNIKIWGLDFGDCHRSLFAHSDSVMAVAFVPRTHYLFTAGKDGAVKYWDADKFEELLELRGHHGEVWALAVSSLGDFVVSGSHDRGLRRWERSEEPFFVEEEKEKRLESLFEEDLGREDGRPLALGPEGGVVGEDGSAPAGKKTLETVGAADAIVDALDLAAEEEARVASGDRGGPNPLMLGLSPSAYVLRAVVAVRGADLEQALLLVPFADALRLLSYAAGWLAAGARTELLCRLATLLLRVHMAALMATPSARPVLTALRGLLRGRVQEAKDALGFNLAALEHLRRLVVEQSGVGGAADAAAAVRPLKRKAEAAGAPTAKR